MPFLVYFAPTLLCGSLVTAAVLIPLIVAANLVRRLFSDAGIPAHLPWAGVGPNGGRLSRARANLASIFGLKRLLDEGYTEVRLHTPQQVKRRHNISRLLMV